jgi:hypothetical protein
MKSVAASNDPGAVNFADDTWVSEFLELSDDPFVEDEELKEFWTQGVNEGNLRGTKIKEYWNEIDKRAPNTAAKDGIDIINNAFDKQIKGLEGKKSKRKQKQLDALRKDKAKAGVMFNDWLKANPDAEAVEIIDYANKVDGIFRTGRVTKNLEEHDEFVNATLNQIQTTGQAQLPLLAEPEKPVSVKPKEELAGRAEANQNREEFERLTGKELIFSGKNQNIHIGTDPTTPGIYEKYTIGRKEWRWYNGGWQVYKKKKGWIDAPEGPQGRQNR